MAAPLTNFQAGGEDLSDIYVDTNTVVDSIDDTISLSVLSEEGRTAVLSRSLWVWGDAAQGAIGLNNSISRSSPTQVGSLTTWTDASDQAAVSINGSMWHWGAATGLNDTISRSSPVQVGSLTNWKNVFSGRFAIKTDNTLWAWGVAQDGGLGLNSSLNRSSPTQVGTLSNWKQATGGSFFEQQLIGQSTIAQFRSAIAMAVKTDGTLWSWGSNRLFGADNGGLGISSTITGQLGLSESIYRSSPVQIGTLTNWKEVSSILSRTVAVTTAVKTDGTLWSWGLNTSGLLGLNSSISRSSPVQIGTDTNWKQANPGLAIKTNGTLWGWGSGINAGLNDSVTRSSPVQVGSLTDWKKLVIDGTSRTGSHAIKTDNTWWTWGAQSVLNDVVVRSSPVQVGADTNWKNIKGRIALKR